MYQRASALRKLKVIRQSELLKLSYVRPCSSGCQILSSPIQGKVKRPACKQPSLYSIQPIRLCAGFSAAWPHMQKSQQLHLHTARGLAVRAKASGSTKEDASPATSLNDQEQSSVAARVWMSGIEAPGQVLQQTAAKWQARTAAYARNSFLLAYTTLVDNTLVALLQALRVDDLFKRATPWLEDSLARLTGTWHTMADGSKLSYSLVNNTAPDFSIPRQYSVDKLFALGQGQAPPAGLEYSPAACHFMSLCMKLVYEKKDVIQDIAENRWGMQLRAYFHTGTDSFTIDPPKGGDTAAFVPRTRAALLTSEHATVLAFRGSEPTNLINLRSAGRISMTERKGMGRVHDGFYGALFHEDQDGGTLFCDLVAAIRAADDGRRKGLYLTGHSLGAALATLFAQVLHSRHPELAERIEGIHAFACPRVGDAAFAAAANAAFLRPRRRLFRIAYGADIIPHLPPRMLEYEDAGDEVFLTSTGQVVLDQKNMKKWHRREGWGFIPLYLYKIIAGAFDSKESKLRTLYRIVLLVVFPGLTDHWPSDYEAKLRKALIRESHNSRGASQGAADEQV